jgi:hypothetical protein
VRAALIIEITMPLAEHEGARAGPANEGVRASITLSPGTKKCRRVTKACSGCVWQVYRLS